MDTDLLVVILLLLIPAALLWGIFIMRNRAARKPGALLGIPHAMRPGQPDSTLEGSRLERVQVGGLVFTLVLAFFIPVYWLPESSRQASFQERFDEESVERGQIIFEVAPPLEEDIDPVEFRKEERAISLGMGCASCHGGVDEEDPLGEATAGGGTVPEFVDPITGATVAYQAPPLQTVFQRWDEEVVEFTIQRGRPGTPMPAWGVAYGGPMTEQMVDDVINFLKALPGNNTAPQISEECKKSTESQFETCGEEIFEVRCAVCHGPEGQGKEGANAGDPWYQGLALWKGDVKHMPEYLHFQTVTNGRRFAFMPPFGEAPAQGIPAPLYPLTDDQIRAVIEYERGL